MSRKKVFVVVGNLIILMMLVVVRHKLGIVPIHSAIAGHEKIDVEIRIKNGQSNGEYDRLMGESVVSGEVDMSIELPIGSDDYTYIEYKINGFNYVTGYSPSYGVTIDTTALPDGWNQLLVVGYNEDGKESVKIQGVKQVIFKVENSLGKKVRASRQGKGYAVGEKSSYKRNYIPVLMYHDFQGNITKEQESAIVHPELFEGHLKVLVENDYTPINFKDLYLYMKGQGGLPSKPVIITADDGYLSTYETAFPILKKYNIPATFFVTTRYVGVETSSPHFTWEQAREMEESGLIDIQSHTHGHLLLNTLPDDEMRYQIGVSFSLIEQNLGERDVKVLAYPQFYNNNHTRKILVEEGVDLQITRLGKWYKATTEPTSIQRIHVANYTSPEDLLEEINKLAR
ncbi:MAG TPA: polysaccharide deacetylase family protein [Epulopiscium sp.]|nr:polysaccharide deacetylase family protein [Candidatus Epulonipiscium sp.]